MCLTINFQSQSTPVKRENMQNNNNNDDMLSESIMLYIATSCLLSTTSEHNRVKWYSKQHYCDWRGITTKEKCFVEYIDCSIHDDDREKIVDLICIIRWGFYVTDFIPFSDLVELSLRDDGEIEAVHMPNLWNKFFYSKTRRRRFGRLWYICDFMAMTCLT